MVTTSSYQSSQVCKFVRISKPLSLMHRNNSVIIITDTLFSERRCGLQNNTRLTIVSMIDLPQNALWIPNKQSLVPFLGSCV